MTEAAAYALAIALTALIGLLPIAWSASLVFLRMQQRERWRAGIPLGILRTSPPRGLVRTLPGPANEPPLGGIAALAHTCGYCLAKV